MAREFRATEAQDFTIVENGRVIGTIRIKPSSIMWKPNRGRAWHGVTPEEFGEFAETQGRKMQK
jgi:hypothetical protein